MTELSGRATANVTNSDFVERRTMSFSLCAVVAEHSKKQNSQPQNWLRPGADASAIHGRLGCSGCTPAEPYPPNRGNSIPNSAVKSSQKEDGDTSFIQGEDQSTKPILPLNQIP
jgi:hypothetical protein